MSSDSDIILMTDTIEDTAVDADPFIVESMSLAITTFENPPPPLFEQAYENESLETVAKQMNILMNQPGVIRFNEQVRKQLLEIITTFTYQSGLLAIERTQPLVLPGTNYEKPPEAPKNKFTDEQFKHLTKELLRVQEEAYQMRRRLQYTDQVEQQLKNAITELQKENDQLFSEKNDLLQKLNSERRERTEAEADLKKNIEDLKIDLNNSHDQRARNEFSISRLQAQLENANKENTELVTEICTLKGKIKSKNSKNKQLSDEYNRMQILVHQLESENENLNYLITEMTQRAEKLETDLINAGPESCEKLQNTCTKLQSTVKKLVEVIDNQNAEITAFQKVKAHMLEVMAKQLTLINNYDKHVSVLGKERDEAVQTYSKLERETKKLREENAECTEKLSSYRGPAFDQIHQILAETVGDVQEDQVVPSIREYFKGPSGLQLLKQNRRLLSMIESQLRFIQGVAQSGDLRASLISGDAEQSDYFTDESVRLLVETEIARCRTYISMNNLAAPENDMQMSKVRNNLATFNNPDDILQREAFDIVSLQIANADIIRAHAERNEVELGKLRPLMKEAASIISCSAEDLPEIAKVLSDTVRDVRRFFKMCNDVAGGIDFKDFPKALNQLESLLKTHMIIVNHLNNEVRETVQYEGPLEEIHTYIHDFIIKLNENYQESYNIANAKANEVINQLQKEINEERIAATHEISKLEKNIEDLNNEIESEKKEAEEAKQMAANTQRELDSTIQKRDEIQKRYDILTVTVEDFEAEVNRLRAAAETDKELSEKRAKLYEERIERVINEERENHKEDLKAVKEKYTEVIQKQEKVIAEKQAKYQEARRRLKEVIQTFDEAFEKQKEVTNSIRQQNIELASLAKEPMHQHPSSHRIDINLASEVNTLRAEKQILEVKLKQANEAVKHEAHQRDTFWNSQLALRETEINQLNDAKLTLLKNAHIEFINRAAEILEVFVPKEFVVSDASLLSLLSDLAARLRDAENDNVALKAARETQMRAAVASSVQNPQAPCISKAAIAIAGVREWERWARHVYKNATQMDSPDDIAQLRFKLSELILVSIQSRRVAKRLESLHDQKAAFLAGAGFYPKSEEVSLKAMAIAFTSVVVLRKVIPKNVLIQNGF